MLGVPVLLALRGYSFPAPSWPGPSCPVSLWRQQRRTASGRCNACGRGTRTATSVWRPDSRFARAHLLAYGDLSLHELAAVELFGTQPVAVAAEHAEVALVVAAKDREGLERAATEPWRLTYCRPSQGCLARSRLPLGCVEPPPGDVISTPHSPWSPGPSAPCWTGVDDDARACVGGPCDPDRHRPRRLHRQP